MRSSRAESGLDLGASDAEVLVDAAVLGAGSVAIVLAANWLPFMTVFVPVLVVARMFAWRLVTRRRRRSLRAEGAFLLLCTVLGGFNDWNSVVHHQIYDYTVAHYFPALTTIPLWMLVYWGLILRFLASVASWERLSKGAIPTDGVRLGFGTAHRGWLKVLLQLVLVVGTRQAIYIWYLEPVLSWAPFAVAAAVYWLLFGIQRRELILGALVLCGGPLIEVLYIHGAGLHRYHLGWIAGVPLWIALWWVVAMWVWADLGLRTRRRLERFGQRVDGTKEMGRL